MWKFRAVCEHSLLTISNIHRCMHFVRSTIDFLEEKLELVTAPLIQVWFSGSSLLVLDASFGLSLRRSTNHPRHFTPHSVGCLTDNCLSGTPSAAQALLMLEGSKSNVPCQYSMLNVVLEATEHHFKAVSVGRLLLCSLPSECLGRSLSRPHASEEYSSMHQGLAQVLKAVA